MVLGLFKKRDPICGMKEEKGKGIKDKKMGHWFCSKNCQDKFNKVVKEEQAKSKKSCCH